MFFREGDCEGDYSPLKSLLVWEGKKIISLGVLWKMYGTCIVPCVIAVQEPLFYMVLIMFPMLKIWFLKNLILFVHNILPTTPWAESLFLNISLVHNDFNFTQI